MNIPGIGPRRAMLIAQELGVKSVADLERALEEGKVAKLPRIGDRVAAHILDEIGRIRSRSQRLPLGVALSTAEEAVRQLRESNAVLEITPAGSIRRMRETIGDIDILVSSAEPERAIGSFTKMPLVKEVLAAGETRASVLTHSDLQIDLRVVPPESYGAALQYFTGSKEHNIKLRELAMKKGLKLNEYGVFAGETRIASATETEVYAALGLPWLPPEIREDTGEVELALQGRVPPLVDASDIRGDLHVHTKLTDGASTIEQMARAAEAAGYEYLAFTDHSQALGVTGGLTEEELRKQHEEIRRLQAGLPSVRLLCGVEVDIHVDKRLDCSDEFLAGCDVVVASIHSALQQPTEVQTARLIAAMENPNVDIIAHPTGRLLGKRPGYDLDLIALLEIAARTGTAVEINAQPERLDLNADAVRAASERRVMLAINTDAHHHDQIGLMRFGVSTARRGWAPPSLVLNTRSVDELTRWLIDRAPTKGGSPA
jgi:DNA polymerase (family 10)